MLSFFTRIPIGDQLDFDEADYDLGILLFPLIGVMIGIFLGLVKWIFGFAPPYVSALLVLLAYLWITGALHLDGLSDSLDGLLSGREKDKKLEIMQDSRVGAFGSIGVTFVLIAYVVLLAESSIGMVLIMSIIGKVGIVGAASISTYARETQGLGTRFIQQCSYKERLMSFGFLALVTILVDYRLIVAVAGALIITGMATNHIKNEIGGMTGDTLGLVHEMAQLTFLLIGSFVAM
jgi:adenosylcobinamide-GDP ribazoletransferase